MKNLLLILIATILTFQSVTGQEKITDYQNLGETYQEFKYISIRSFDNIDYLIENSSSQLRVSTIDSSTVTELYTKSDFPEGTGLGRIFSFWKPVGPHIVSQGMLIEFFQDEIRTRELVSGEIIDAWLFDESDLEKMISVETYGHHCFMWFFDGRFGYLDINTGELNFVDQEDEGVIVNNGMIYLVKDNDLIQLDPNNGMQTIIKDYPHFTSTKSYTGVDGENVLIINAFLEGIDVFDGNQFVQYPMQENIGYISAIHASDKYMAIVWKDNNESNLQVIDLDLNEEVFSRDEISSIDGYIAIDKDDLDDRHFIMQFSGFGGPLSLLFDSETGEISEFYDPNFNDIRLSEKCSFNKDSSLYLLGPEVSETFGTDALQEFEFLKVNRSDLSTKDISSVINTNPYVMSNKLTDRTLVVGRSSARHNLSVFNDEEDVNQIHTMLGYKNIGYEDIEYLATHDDNLLLATNGELHLVGKDLLEIYDGDVHSVKVNSNIANGLMFGDSLPYFFTLDMNDGSIQLDGLNEDITLGITSHIGNAIFGDFTKNQSLYFNPSSKTFVDLDVDGPIVDFYTSNDRALLQISDGSDNRFYVFDGGGIVKIEQVFGSEVDVVPRSDGTFIILESEDNANTLYFIDRNGNVSDSISAIGDRLMWEDQYLIDGPFSVLFFHGDNVLTTVMSLYGRFQASESEYISSNQNTRGVRYSKGKEGVLLQKETCGQISYARWNSEIIQLDVPTQQSLVIAYFDDDNIRLVSSYFDESSYSLLDKNSGELISREDIDYTSGTSINYSQNQKYRLNNNDQYLLSSALDDWAPHPASLVADFSDSENLTITLLRDFGGGSGLYSASDFIYTDNHIYAKALYDNIRSEYQLYRISTADGVTYTNDVFRDADEELNIFPNISNHLITVNEELFDLKIIDQSGVVVYRKQELKSLENITIENLPTGIYFLHGATDKGESKLGRFIKS